MFMRLQTVLPSGSFAVDLSYTRKRKTRYYEKVEMDVIITRGATARFGYQGGQLRCAKTYNCGGKSRTGAGACHAH